MPRGPGTAARALGHPAAGGCVHRLLLADAFVARLDPLHMQADATDIASARRLGPAEKLSPKDGAAPPWSPVVGRTHSVRCRAHLVLCRESGRGPLPTVRVVSSSNRRRPGPASYGPAANWPEGPFPAAKDPATLMAVQTAAVVASAVRRERAARFWSQDSLAEVAEVSRTTITRLEAGTGWVDLQVLVRVANVLELKVALVPIR